MESVFNQTGSRSLQKDQKLREVSVRRNFQQLLEHRQYLVETVFQNDPR